MFRGNAYLNRVYIYKHKNVCLLLMDSSTPKMLRRLLRWGELLTICVRDPQYSGAYSDQPMPPLAGIRGRSSGKRRSNTRLANYVCQVLANLNRPPQTAIGRPAGTLPGSAPVPVAVFAVAPLPLKIAQPFMAGFTVRECSKSRQGRKNFSAVPRGTFTFG